MSFDKRLLTPCPVLTPSPEEFANPIEYLSRSDITEIGSKYGIVKLIPPSNWKPPFLISEDFKFHTRHQKLSDLGLTTRSRNFFNDNINRFLKMRRKKQLKLYFMVKGYENLKIYYYDLYVAVEQNGGCETLDNEKWHKINIKFGLPFDSTILTERYNLCIRPYAVFLSNNHNKTFEFPDSDSEDEMANCLLCGKHNSPTQTLLCDNCDNPFHMKCLSPPLENIPSGNWYCDKCLIGTGEYGFDEPTEIKYTLPQFNDMCKDFESKFKKDNLRLKEDDVIPIDTIERKFWEYIDIEKSDLEVKYGADIHNLRPGQISGFPMSNTPHLSSQLTNANLESYIKHPCNLTKLPFAKGSLLNFINTSISGMTIPWIYIGSLFSTFCWHVEDHYTLSANYCHFGATKKWYGIPSDYADKFEKLMKDSAPDLFRKQPDLLHQLVTLLSPMTLVKNGIPCIYVDQQPNEFVITYPRVYHAGFNCGFNFNEAVNFSMHQWLEFGEKSIQDYKLIKKENVFNHYQLVENILIKFLKKTHKENNLDLVQRCIKSFEKFYNDQCELLSKLDNEDSFILEYRPKFFKQRKFEDEQIGFFSNDNNENEDEEYDLCDICRTNISYQYIIINNEKHNFDKISLGNRNNRLEKESEITVLKEDKEEQYTSPNVSPSTPNLTQEGKFTKISISQLLTPDSSPYEEVKPRISQASMDKFKLGDDLNSIIKTEKTPAADEWEKLIENSKRDCKDGGLSNKRRRSNRLQKLESSPVKNTLNVELRSDNKEPYIQRQHQHHQPTSKPMSKMTIVQNSINLTHLNEKEQIRLCLLCCLELCGTRGERVPAKSSLIYESYPEQMKNFLHQCKHKYQDAI